MMSRTTARRRLGAAALATMAAGLLVSPAGAASREPTGECPPGQRDLVAMQRELVTVVAPVQDIRVLARANLLAHTTQVRKVLEARLAEAGRLQDTIRLEVEIAEIAKTADLESLRAAVWMGRDLDTMRLFADRDWDQLGFELDFETTPGASHPVTAAIDALVNLAQLPARASLVVQHLVGAFAKVTPRVVRALL